MKRATLLIIVYCIFFSSLVQAQDSLNLTKTPLKIQRLTQQINFDGLSDDSAWLSATSLPFMVIDPVWGQNPSEKTEMFVAYDDDFLWIAGRCFQDSATIVARTLVRDGWRGDDWMTFHIDSRFDKQNAFVFSIYPLGSRYDMATGNDAVELGNATFNPTFNMFWDARAIINQKGWFFEMKIPLYNLRFKANKRGEITMGISSTRAIQHKQEYHQFPAVPQNAIEPIMKPSLKQPAILADIPRPRLFLLTPYTLLSRNRSYELKDENKYRPQVDYNAQIGLDAKIGVSPYLTLDVSLNPDFAQVEADDQLVNLTRFSLFFTEKRLFFQEQAGVFEFNLGGNSQLFYSRQIGINAGQLTDIYGGVRLTGKLNADTDIGFLNMQSAKISLTEGDKIPSENFGILRLRHKVLNDKSFAGLMLTNRNSGQNQNYTVGADFLFNPVRNHYFLLATATSLDKNNSEKFTKGLDASRLAFLWETRRTDGLFHRLGYIYSGQNFNPEVGFVDRSNFHNFNGNLSYGRFAKVRKGRFQYKRLTLLNWDTYLNAQTGKWETIDLSSDMRLRTFKSSSITTTLTYSYEFLASDLDFGNDILIKAGEYRFATLRLSYAQPRFRNIRTAFRFSEGGFFDGRRFNFNFSPVFNLGKHLEIQSSYDYSYLRFSDKNLYRHIHILRLQVNYAMNLHFSASLITQYNSNVNQFFNNFRLRYNFKDGHDLFIVWNENFFTERRMTDSDILRPISGDQALILKYSYTFDKIFKKKDRKSG